MINLSHIERIVHQLARPRLLRSWYAIARVSGCFTGQDAVLVVSPWGSSRAKYGYKKDNPATKWMRGCLQAVVRDPAPDQQKANLEAPA